MSITRGVSDQPPLRLSHCYTRARSHRVAVRMAGGMEGIRAFLLTLLVLLGIGAAPAGTNAAAGPTTLATSPIVGQAAPADRATPAPPAPVAPAASPAAKGAAVNLPGRLSRLQASMPPGRRARASRSSGAAGAPARVRPRPSFRRRVSPPPHPKSRSTTDSTSRGRPPLVAAAGRRPTQLGRSDPTTTSRWRTRASRFTTAI